MGGLCFLAGMFIMAYNVARTIAGKPAVDAPIPASLPASAH
jgi:cytochrome c oxidase cbb3-type subunit 1